MSDTTTPARPRGTKKFKALVAAGVPEATVFEILGWIDPSAPAKDVDPRRAALEAVGLTPEQIEAALSDNVTVALVQPEPKPEAPKPPTAKEVADKLVADSGLGFTKGRVYTSPNLIEAQVRVYKTGSPEIVQAITPGRTYGVLVFKDDNGLVGLQNVRTLGAEEVDAS